MKTKSKTNRIPDWTAMPRTRLLVVAMGAMLSLAGCSSGGSSSSAGSTASWPSTPPPATSQTNTYVGTQSPGLYSVNIDHTKNTFSYQDLSTSNATVSGSFTTTSNGFLVLSTSAGTTGYALEQLSRALLLVPPLATKNNQPLFTSAPVFAVVAPSCQVIPNKTAFEYLATANPNYDYVNTTNQQTVTERQIVYGQVFGSTDSGGANWEFGGEVQYYLAIGASGTPPIYIPTPEPFSATCAAGSFGSSVIQTAITVPSSTPANFLVGPTGFFVEDRYQSDGLAFVGAVAPPSPVDLSQLSGATFLGVEASGGASPSQASPTITAPQLVSFSAAAGSSGTNIKLTGGAFPSNDPTQVPVTSYTLNLGAQDPANNGSFPSATIVPSGSSSGTAAYALVNNAGGKYSIFVTSVVSGSETSFILFQQ